MKQELSARARRILAVVFALCAVGSGFIVFLLVFLLIAFAVGCNQPDRWELCRAERERGAEEGRVAYERGQATCDYLQTGEVMRLKTLEHNCQAEREQTLRHNSELIDERQECETEKMKLNADCLSACIEEKRNGSWQWSGTKPSAESKEAFLGLGFKTKH